MNGVLSRLTTILPVALLLAVPRIANAHITVDGDLTDLIALKHADQADPELDVTDAFVSGWDFNHVYLFYNPKRDTLYVGLQLTPNGSVPGVPGDADGDRDPNDTSRLDVPVDQFGVGADETYTIAIDSDLNGSFEDVGDVLFLYRDNEIRMIRGDGSVALGDMHGEIALGMSGATDGTGLPQENEDTDAIEIAIKNFSLAFADQNSAANPCSFGLDVFAGSLVDTLEEDRLDSPLLFTFPQGVIFENAFADAPGPNTACAEAPVGSLLTIEATITNTTELTLTPVWINHHIPNGLEFVAGSLTGATQGKIVPLENGVLVRHLRPGGDPSMEPGEIEVVTFQVRVVAESPDPVHIRGYAEGVLSTDRTKCVFSCLDALCVITATP